MEGSGRAQGFSLLQLIIALAITAILSSLSSDAFSSLLWRQQSRQAINTFDALFQFARTTAVYNHIEVTVCGVDINLKCVKEWHSGSRVLVFHDTDGNRAADSGDPIFRSIDWSANKGRLTWRAALGRAYLVFSTSGGTWQNGTLVYCPSNGDPTLASAIVVSQSGRSFVPGDSDGDGVNEDSAGKDLQCSL